MLMQFTSCLPAHVQFFDLFINEVKDSASRVVTARKALGAINASPLGADERIAELRKGFANSMWSFLYPPIVDLLSNSIIPLQRIPETVDPEIVRMMTENLYGRGPGYVLFQTYSPLECCIDL